MDLSDFCTSQQHAIDRAKFECRFRRLSTHQVKFTTIKLTRHPSTSASASDWAWRL